MEKLKFNTHNTITVYNCNKSTEQQILTVLWEQSNIRHISRPHDIFHFGELDACQRPGKHDTQTDELSLHKYM